MFTAFTWLNYLTWEYWDKNSMMDYLERPRDFLAIQDGQWSLQDTRVQFGQVNLSNAMIILSKTWQQAILMTIILKTVEHGNVNFKIDDEDGDLCVGQGSQGEQEQAQDHLSCWCSLTVWPIDLYFSPLVDRYLRIFVLDFSQTYRSYFCPLLDCIELLILLQASKYINSYKENQSTQNVLFLSF